jgi:hypothetical protein
MANVIDIIVSKQAQAELDKVIASLKLTHEEIIKINQQGLKINSGASPKNPQQMNQSVKETIALNEKLDATTNKLIVTEKKLQQERVKELQLQKQREQSVDKYNAQLAKEEQKLSNAANMYNRLQAELNKLNFAYQNLAVRQAQGASLTRAEAEQMDYLRSRIQMHDKTLKAVDANMGKYGRNVGNYASGFNPLNNSIAQLGREMPAFANSVQTGFMAISNNLPIFFDAMQGVIAQNKELQAQGKPTKSVLSQLAGALFSFQTLLSVGVTLLTVYGKEIVSWVSTLWGASDALNELNKNQKEFNNARFQGKKDAQSDIIELKKYLAVYNDTSLSVQDREIAYKKLSQQYAYYIKNVSDATMVNGKYSDGVSKLLVDLEKQKALEKETDLQVTNKQKLIDLEKELTSLTKLEKQKEKSLKSAVESNLSAQGLATISNELNSIREKRIKIDKDIDAYQNAINKNQVEIIKLTKDRIGLEYTEDKQREKKKKDLQELADLEIDQADFLAREYELRKKILENGITNNKIIADNEKNTLSERIDAYQLYMSLKEQLVQAEFDEQNRIIDTEYKNQINTINDAYSEQIKAINKGVIDGGTKRIQAESEKNEALKALEKKYFFDRQINYTEFEQKSKEIRETYSKDEELALISKYSRLDQINEVQLAKLNALRNRNFTGGTLTQETPLSSFKSYYDEKGKIEEDARVKSLNADLAINQTKLQSLTFNNKTESEEYKKLTAEKIALELQLQEIKDSNAEKEIKKLEEFKKLLNETFNGFISDFGSTSGFGKMIDILNGGLDKFEGNAKAVALSVSDAFQEAYNTISERSQANFDAEYSRLERQKEFAIMFAGESSTAKEEIERQYEERKRAIARREAEAQKRLAIFNIAIDTAQAVVAALPNIPLSIVMGVLGAAQIAMVSSQQIPQFWTGTENAPEGLAWTQEKGAEVITDKKGNVKTFGNNKGAQLTYLEKGDKVYKSQQDYINKTLVNSGIQPMRENNSLTSSDFNNGISKLAKTMQSNKGSNTQVFLNNKQINTDYFKGQRV